MPVGAVIVHGREIIARAHNQVEMLKDPTAHAEMIAITQAEEGVGDAAADGGRPIKMWPFSNIDTVSYTAMSAGAYIIPMVWHLNTVTAGVVIMCMACVCQPT